MPFGEKFMWIGDMFGPANYQAGGASIQARALGLSGFEWFSCAAGSSSGNYYVSALYPGGSSNNESRPVTAGSINVQWYSANGVEVPNGTNLSAEQTRLMTIGI